MIVHHRHIGFNPLRWTWLESSNFLQHFVLRERKNETRELARKFEKKKKETEKKNSESRISLRSYVLYNLASRRTIVGKLFFSPDRITLPL